MANGILWANDANLRRLKPREMAEMKLSGSQRAVINGISHGFSAAVGIATGFVVMPAVVHGIGLTEFGIWAIGTTLVGYMSLLDFGLSQTLIKKSSEHLANGNLAGLNSVVNTLLVLYLFLAATTILICIPLFYWGPVLFNVPSESVLLFRQVLAILAALAAINFPMSILSGLVGGVQDFYVSNLANIVLNVLRAVSTIILLRSGYGLLALIWVAVGVSIAGWLANFLWVRFRIPELYLNVRLSRREDVKEVAQFSASMFIWATAGQVYQAADRLIVGMLFSVASLGAYEIGARLNSYSRVLLNVVLMAIPAASALLAKGEFAKIQDLYFRGSKYVFAAYGIVAFPALFLGPGLMELWMGPGFEQSILIAQILICASFFQSQNSLGHSLLVGMGKLDVFTKAMAAYPVVIVCLAAIAGAVFGLVGVALGVACAVVLMEGLIAIHLTRVMSVSLSHIIMKWQLPVAASGVAAAFLAIMIFGARERTWANCGMELVVFELMYAILFAVLGLSVGERKMLYEAGAAFRLNRE